MRQTGGNDFVSEFYLLTCQRHRKSTIYVERKKITIIGRQMEKIF